MSNCYATTLYGDNDYYFGALVLGYSLKKVTTLPMVIMVTPDVPTWKIKNLREFWRPVYIDYMNVEKSWIKNYETTRHRHVFTKLHVLNLTEFKKVILLDLDMLVLKNMDKLFEIQPPAAMLGGFQKLQTGNLVPKKGQINAGILLVEPNKSEFIKIADQLSRPCPHSGYAAPEQQYLSDRWSGRWRHITQHYNFQYYNYHTYIQGRQKANIRYIYNIHYSFVVKPWHYYITNKKWAAEKLSKYKAQRNYKAFFSLWNDAYNGVNEKLGKDLTQEVEIEARHPGTRFARLPRQAPINWHPIVGNYSFRDLLHL